MLKRYLNALFILAAMTSLNACSNPKDTITSCNDDTQIQVCFSPGQNCTQIITDAIDATQHSIYVQAYSFTSYPIAKALVKASERGVTVSIIVDKSDIDPAHYSVLPYLKKHNINLHVDDQVNIAHNKVMIFDDNAVETGSFNFTNAAQRQNAENMLIIRNSQVAEVYMNNWQKRLDASRPL